MSMHDWMNTSVPAVVDRLEKAMSSGYTDHSEEGLDLTGRTAIYDVLDDILAVLFPDAYSKKKVDRADMIFVLDDLIRHICLHLGAQIRNVFKFRCRKRGTCADCTCEQRADDALKTLVTALPEIRAVLMEDIQAAYEGDPAAQSLDEIVLSYPCIEAISTHRIAHLLYTLDVPIIPRIMSERAHSRTGIDIHPGATIGPRFFIDHGTGVVIGETCVIGRNVKLYQGVTLGALSFSADEQGNLVRGTKRHPDIEDDVVIYANATILGGATVIGKGAVIGGNTWVTRSVPAGNRVYNENKVSKGNFVDGAGI